jgi:DNA-binding transcriptional ArsR family regulator
MTLFALRTADDLLTVRFAVSPVWETQAAVQALADERGHSYHESWLLRVQGRAARLDLAPLLAALPRRGEVPDFLTPPPRTCRPTLRSQLAEIRATEPAQVARELARCRETVSDEPYRRLLTSLLADPERARDLLAARLYDAWASLIAPYWVRIRALLDRDVEERSRVLTRHGLRRVLDELHPKLRWTASGLLLADRSDRTVQAGRRGFLLMPSAYLWPHVASTVDEPWLPTIIYPAAGIARLWQPPAAPPEALGRLLGRTRARVLTALDQPISTTALAAVTGLSPAGASRHLLALRDAGLVSAARHGHEVRYRRTELGSALLHGRQENDRSAGRRPRR